MPKQGRTGRFVTGSRCNPMSTRHRHLLALAVTTALSQGLRAAEQPAVAARSDQPHADATKPGRGPMAVDPMHDLRERLAARLGATRTSIDKGEPVVRVVGRPDGELQLTAQPDAPSKAPAIKTQPARASGHRDGNHWSYDGQSGPQAWGRLKPEFSKCATGTRQSPIDIRDGIHVDLEPVQFDYKPSVFSVLDNGHTVQVNVAPGNFIEVMGRRFELVQFHFHRPSEERIDGKQFDMGVHLVHKDIGGRLAVVAVLLARGSAHPIVQSVWNNLPLEKGDEVSARVSLDLNQLLPKDTRYYIYMGSLTTPPCSEGVLWMVMQQPVAVSQEQVDVFGRLYPMNARPLQQASGRLIKQSN
jgi:carbonic anhydrase